MRPVHRRWARLRLLLAAATFLTWQACAREVSRPPASSVILNLVTRVGGDDRVYSVGRVQLRAIDADDQVLASEIFLIDRTTGIIDLDFAVPAGPARRILVEPLGSGILPGGGKTESGVALQGVSAAFDLEAGSSVAVTVPLEPYIPDHLRRVASQGDLLAWDSMAPARSHTVRVFERSGNSGPVTTRLAPVGQPPVAIAALVRTGQSLVAAQVRSENEFSSSAFSDTLFFETKR